LEAKPRSSGDATIRLEIPTEPGRNIEGMYIPLTVEQYRPAGTSGKAGAVALPEEVHAVIATASAQPYSTAAAFANLRNLPLWLDVFGDPLTEIQTQADLLLDDEEANGERYVHTWK